MDLKEVDLSGLKTMQLNDQKAGMQGLDKEMINKIIFEASQGTPYFTFQEKRQKTINSKVSKLKADIEKISELQRKISLEKMTSFGLSLEEERDLSHSIVHIDMDAFYAAVEILDDPALKDVPMAVGSSSMLSTSNYLARKYGVRAAMPGFIAKKLCPELVIVPCNFSKYKKVSYEIRDIIKEYDPDYSPAGLDEMYLDLTNYIKRKYKEQVHNESCLKNNTPNASECTNDADDVSSQNYETCEECSQPVDRGKRDEMAYDIVQEIRQKICATTQLTASAGIAPNTMLAKVCSDQNKPNGQYQIHSTIEAVKSFISSLPVKKVSGIGPVQGQILNAIGIHTCADMWEKRDLVGILFNPAAKDFYMRAALGIGSTTVKSDYVRKSIGSEETFKEIHHPDDLHRKCQELCDEVMERLKLRNMLGKVVTLKLKTTDFKSHTKHHSLASYTADKEIVYKAAKKLLDAEIMAVAPKPLRLRLMGLRLVNLVYEDSVPNSEKHVMKLKDFLQTKSASRNKTSPAKSSSENYVCPVCRKNFETNPELFEDHVHECIDSDSEFEDGDKQQCNIETLDKDLHCKNLFSKAAESSVSGNCETQSNAAMCSEDNTSENYIGAPCPICGVTQEVDNLVKLNAHIDNCLNRVAIKEILTDDLSQGIKRKVVHRNEKGNMKKSKIVKTTEKGIDHYFKSSVV